MVWAFPLSPKLRAGLTNQTDTLDHVEHSFSNEVPGTGRLRELALLSNPPAKAFHCKGSKVPFPSCFQTFQLNY